MKKKVEKKSKIVGSSEIDKNNRKDLVLAQEIKFAKLLASNDERIRSKILKSLRRWLTARCSSAYGFQEADFMRIWKGLFYYMWMSDKPLVQEEIAENISKIVHCFTTSETALLYTKSTFKSLSNEWFGIDKFRVDKFEMLVRRILRQTFIMCQNREWDLDTVKELGKILEGFLLDRSTSLGLLLHISNIFMEEFSKIAAGKTSPEVITELLRPFVLFVASSSEERKTKTITKDVFRYLIFQSDVGIEYQTKFQVWKQAGFPCGSINDIQKIDVSDDEDELEEETNEDKNKPLDPRAGHVSVDLPQIIFDPQQMVDLLTELKFHKTSTTKGRKQLTKLIGEFKELVKGEMPIGVKTVEVPKKPNHKIASEEAVLDLYEFDRELYSDSSKNLKRKRDDCVEKNGVAEMSPRKKSHKAKTQNTFKVEDLTTMEGPKTKRRYSTDNTWSVSNFESPVVSAQEPSKKMKKSATDSGEVLSTPKKLVETPKATPSPKKKSLSSKKKSLSPTVPVILKKSPEKPVEILPKKASVQLTPSPKKKALSPAVAVKKSVETVPRRTLLQTLSNSEQKKKVKIMLNKNTFQHTSEYFRTLRQNPSVPYDADRKPGAGLLKRQSIIPTPMDPFYNSL